jgi:hypothetical protein
LRLLINRLIFEEVLVLGDSHSRVFHSRILRSSLKRHFFNVLNIGGATASGLDNPMSKTKAYSLFSSALQQTKANKVILMLGEVDTGYVIWYRAKKYNEEVGSMLERTVTTYQGFVEKVAHSGFSPVCVSTALPTIKDTAPRGEVAKARAIITASQKERTELTLEFNRQVARFCEELGAAFIDLDPQSLGPDGLVKPELLNPDPSNHHYHRPAHARLLAPHLVRLLEG